jgi:hypothetical protein
MRYLFTFALALIGLTLSRTALADPHAPTRPKHPKGTPVPRPPWQAMGLQR